MCGGRMYAFLHRGLKTISPDFPRPKSSNCTDSCGGASCWSTWGRVFCLYRHIPAQEIFGHPILVLEMSLCVVVGMSEIRKCNVSLDEKQNTACAIR